MLRANPPFVIGVTGKIACGKSSVLARLQSKGTETIDADHVYHELIRPGLPLWHALRDEFGSEIVGADGEINRRALGQIVFTDPKAMRKLDEITHPAIGAEIERRISETMVDVIAVDAIKLVESGMDRTCDVVWRVVCEPSTQIARLIQRNGLSEEEAERRIAAQPLSPRTTRPETVIDNSGDLVTLAQAVDGAWNALIPSRLT